MVVPRTSPLAASAIALSLAAGVAGCHVGKITAPGYSEQDGGGPNPTDPEEIFEVEVVPLLNRRCGSCHEDGSSAPMFMDPSDLYGSVLGFRGLVVPGEPTMSTLITKGMHDGPPWNATERPVIERWIEAEGDGGPIEPPPGTPRESDPISVMAGANRIPLDSIGLTGSAVTFTAVRLSMGYQLNGITLTAGSSGAAISNPRFVIQPMSGAEILAPDVMAGVQPRLRAGESMELTNQVVLSQLTDSSTLSIRFASAGPY